MNDAALSPTACWLQDRKPQTSKTQFKGKNISHVYLVVSHQARKTLAVFLLNRIMMFSL